MSPSGTFGHQARMYIAGVMRLSVSEAVLDAEVKRSTKLPVCTGANLQADIGQQGNVFTVTVQGFWLACRSNDFAEVANCTGPAP